MDVSVTDGRYLAFGSFILDPARRTLSHRGAPVAISPTVFDTLLYLVEHPRRIVSKDELLEAVWHGKTVEESNIKQTVFTLRGALTAAGGPHDFIQTAPGRGYRFTAPVEVQTWKAGQVEQAHFAYAISPQLAVAAPMAAAAKPSSPWRLAGLWLAAAVVVALAGGGGLYWWDAHRPLPHNLVVLADFKNLSKDPLFDNSLAQAVQIDLVQSPAITLLPDARLRETLTEMTLSPDAPLTPALAQQVCARNNGQAAVSAAVATVGDRYLLTLTATDCVEGQILAAEKAEVASKDALLPALDVLVGKLRNRLGESHASIATFNAPMLQRRTASLAALQAYSQGHDLFNHGKRLESIDLFKKAIELDPKFAVAYSDLARVYSNLREQTLAKQYALKAYSLKSGESPLQQLQIAYTYAGLVSGDAEEKVRILRQMTTLYPNDEAAWANLADSEDWIGQYPAAIAAAQRAVASNPSFEGPYAILCKAYMHASQFDKAAATCAVPVAKHMDGDETHSLLLQLAYVRGDQAGVARELAWSKGKPDERTQIINQALEAFRRGQVQQGVALFAQIAAQSEAVGLPDFTAAPNARLLNDLGLPDLARQYLAKVPAGFDSADYRFALAELGDPARAETLVRTDLHDAPSNTLLSNVSAPEVNAALALRRGDPRAAIDALKPAGPYELKTYDIPYLRGCLELAADDGAQAAIEFHKVLDNPGIEPVSPLYSLAQLGLARALRLQNDRAGSAKAYEAFFADWKDADADLPLLRAARAEYAALKSAKG